MGGSIVVRASMGNLTGAFGFPNGPIPGTGGVTATGSAPATLRVPEHRFVADFMTVRPLAGESIPQIATSLGVDAPYAAATLAAGGGPGSSGGSFGYYHSFFTVMGSDARTPLGAGNLSLVAGGLSFRNTLVGQSPSASFQKVSLTLGAPIPSLSPAGLAAAAALVLLAAGWALRERVA